MMEKWYSSLKLLLMARNLSLIYNILVEPLSEVHRKVLIYVVHVLDQHTLHLYNPYFLEKFIGHLSKQCSF